MPSRIDIESLPARYREQIAAQTGKRTATPSAKLSHPVAAEGAAMLRQSSRGMNKTEALFFAHLQATHPGAWIEREPMALKLGNGVRYNPDFAVYEQDGEWTANCQPERLTFYEVKGHMRDDAAVKLKVAASRFPFIRFILVWRDLKSGGWRQQIITS